MSERTWTHGTHNGYANRGCRCDECRAAHNAYEKERRADDPERAWAVHQAWLSANRDKTRAYDAKRRARDPERIRARNRGYRDANPDRARERARRWYADNSERVLAQVAEYARANPDKVRARNARRRARHFDALVVPFTAEQLADRLSMFPGCWVCGGEPTAVDHVKPLAKGGLHVLANLRPICKPCNSSKGARWPFRVSEYA